MKRLTALVVNVSTVNCLVSGCMSLFLLLCQMSQTLIHATNVISNTKPRLHSSKKIDQIAIVNYVGTRMEHSQYVLLPPETNSKTYMVDSIIDQIIKEDLILLTSASSTVRVYKCLSKIVKRQELLNIKCLKLKQLKNNNQEHNTHLILLTFNFQKRIIHFI